MTRKPPLFPFPPARNSDLAEAAAADDQTPSGWIVYQVRLKLPQLGISEETTARLLGEDRCLDEYHDAKHASLTHISKRERLDGAQKSPRACGRRAVEGMGDGVQSLLIPVSVNRIRASFSRCSSSG